MTNHVHMALQVADVPLSYIAHNLLFRYARWFHRKYGRSGHLFERRYRAFLVETDGALLSLIRYIHLNPVRAQLVDDPGTYPWSSYVAYLDPDPNARSWLTLSLVLSALADNEAEARMQLREYTELDDEQSEGCDGRSPFGGRTNIEQGSRCVRKERNTAAADHTTSAPELDEILRAVSSACQLESSKLRADVQARVIVRARSLASFVVRRMPGRTLEELGAAVGRDASTLSRSARNLEQRLAGDSVLRAILKRVEENLRRS